MNVAYSDKPNGRVAVHFTLQNVPANKVRSAGVEYMRCLGLNDVDVVDIRTSRQPTNPLAFVSYIAYGNSNASVNYSMVPEDSNQETLDRETIEDLYSFTKRKLVLLGCALESDAHTMGIDAILNKKGIKGNFIGFQGHFS
jgi:beta-lysine 5,6-aminomutase beta subunit